MRARYPHLNFVQVQKILSFAFIYIYLWYSVLINHVVSFSKLVYESEFYFSCKIETQFRLA